MNDTPQLIPMTRAQALDCESKIITKSNELARLLIDMKERQGWKALGFRSWTAYLESDRLNQSRATLYRAMKHYQLSQIDTYNGLNLSQQKALREYPDTLQPAIRQGAETVAKLAGGSLTAGIIKSVGENITQGVTTGFVDDDENPLSIAVRSSEIERKQRQRQHISESRGETYAGMITGRVRSRQGNNLWLELDNMDALVQVQERVKLIVYVIGAENKAA